MKLTKFQSNAIQQILSVCTNSENVHIDTVSDDAEVIISQVTDLHVTNITIYTDMIALSFISKNNISNSRCIVLNNDLDLAIQVKPFIN